MKHPLSAWFAGPKSENSEAFARTILRILEDHQYWRRNYFPEDGVVVTSEDKRNNAAWTDLFDDHLNELLAALKADCPFSSPRYAAHMLAEQTLPSIAGYFAGMLYNPNNVSKEAAPVTVQLELEVGHMIAEMLGFPEKSSWTHLTSGGTVANLEALWVARTAKYLPFALRDVVARLHLDHPLAGESDKRLLGLRPEKALLLLEDVFEHVREVRGNTRKAFRMVVDALQRSEWNVTYVGLSQICDQLGSSPVVLAPETYHYCLPKACDLLGIGRRSMVLVEVDERFRMRPDALRKAIEDCDAEGHHILAVVGIAGSTEEGAIDPIDKILEIRHEREISHRKSFWIHVDAAYGGYMRTSQIPKRKGFGAALTEVEIDEKKYELALQLPGADVGNAIEQIGNADSAIIDPHKLGYVPYPAGIVCFRSNLVRPLMRQNAHYIGEQPAGPKKEKESESIGVYILEGSKPGASAASVWLSHKTIPLNASGHGKLIEETVRNAAELHALLIRWPELGDAGGMQAVPLTSPDTNIICYAFRPAQGDFRLVDLNALNRNVYDGFSLSSERRMHVYDQHFFISRTVLTHAQYSTDTVRAFLGKLAVKEEEWTEEGLFLMRSTLMNPWYGMAKRRGRNYLTALVRELYAAASDAWAAIGEP